MRANGIMDSTLPNVYVQQIQIGLKRINFNLVVKFPNTSPKQLASNEAPYMLINVLLFNGKEGKKLYESFLYKPPRDFGNYLEEIQRNNNSGLKIAQTKISTSHIFQKRIEDIIEDIREVTDDGTLVYNIPYNITMNMPEAYPDDLRALIYTSADVPDILLDFNKIPNHPSFSFPYPTGKIEKEIIISNKKLQENGMLFYISENQEDEAHEERFNSMKGQLWFGGVHKHNRRYMALNWHKPDTLHPYLDYKYVKNKKLQDLRWVNLFEKQQINLESPRTKEVDNYPIFSSLYSSPSRCSRVKLFFGIDVGKLLKQNSELPAIIDKLISFGSGEYIDLLRNWSLKTKSFKILRQRVDINGDVVNPTSDVKVVYESYNLGKPDVFFYKNRTGQKTTVVGGSTPLKTTSALVSVELDKKLSNINDFVKHYSFTDYEVSEVGKGIFQYIIDIKYEDHTVPFLLKQKTILEKAEQLIRKYSNTVTGNKSGYFNSSLNKFNENFMPVAKKLGFTKKQLPSAVRDSFKTLKFLFFNTAEGAIDPEINALFLSKMSQMNNDFFNMLNPTTATPDSISAIKEIYDMALSFFGRFLKSLSNAKNPKSLTNTGADGNIILQQTNRELVGAPIAQRVFEVRHTFSDNLVDTSRFAAAYDFLSGVNNASPLDIGLKLINASDYSQRVKDETSYYFNDSNATFDLSVDLPSGKFSIASSVNTTSTRYLSLAGARQKDKTVFLPTEFTSNNIINKILLYNRHNLVDNNLVTFKDTTYSLTNAIIDSDKQEGGGRTDSAPENMPTTKTSTSVGHGEPLTKSTSANNLLNFTNLLNIENNLDLDLVNYNLGAYNLSNQYSFISNSFFNLEKQQTLSDTCETLKERDVRETTPKFNFVSYMTSVINSWPNQTKALLLATTQPTFLSENVNYLNDNTGLYDPATMSLKVEKFQEFWFRHMNIVEVEYLSGYQQTQEQFLSAEINSPIWSPLTPTAFNSLSEGVLVCRLKKYNGEMSLPLWPPSVYEKLDLPLYDEYFLITPDNFISDAKITTVVPANASPPTLTQDNNVKKGTPTTLEGGANLSQYRT